MDQCYFWWSSSIDQSRLLQLIQNRFKLGCSLEQNLQALHTTYAIIKVQNFDYNDLCVQSKTHTKNDV